MILFNTRVLIQPKDVYEYFLEHKDGLDSRMDIIAESDTDDFDKKSFLFLTTDFEGNRELFLSLEAPEVIVDSETCTDINDVKKTVEDFIKQLDKLQPIVLMEDVYGPFLENNICNIINKYCLFPEHFDLVLIQGGKLTFTNNPHNFYIYNRLEGNSIGRILTNDDDIIINCIFYEQNLNRFSLDVLDLTEELMGYKLEIQMKEQEI